MRYEPERLNEHHYLILYVMLVIPVAVSFLFMRRGSKPPVKLRMNARAPDAGAGTAGGAPGAGSASAAAGARGLDVGIGERGIPAGRPNAANAKYVERPRVKSLNVNFNWNGHNWDAYEVLGVPAGSSIENAHAAYLKMLDGAEPDSQPFFKAAYDAILGTY